MKRAWLLILSAALLTGSPARAWTAGAEPAAEKPSDRYVVPEGNVAELVEFTQRLARFRPTTAEEDVEHRSKYRRALQQAAEAIIELEKDKASPAHQAAEFILLSNRAHWISQGTGRDQRQTVADVKAYLVKNRDTNQGTEAANLAKSVGQALERCGQWRIATEAYAAFAEVVAESARGESADMARTMAAKARRLQAASEGSVLKPNWETQPKGKMVPLDLRSKFNWRAVDILEGKLVGNGLAELPQGEQLLGGVKFRIDDGMIQLGSERLLDAPARVEEIAVNRNITRLYVLHAAQYGSPNILSDGERVGEYRIHYEDGAAAPMPIVFGEDFRGWWNLDQGKPVTRGRVAWTGSNAATERYHTTLRLYLGAWENPHPDKKVTTVDFVSAMDTVCAPFCVAMTVEEP